MTTATHTHSIQMFSSGSSSGGGSNSSHSTTAAASSSSNHCLGLLTTVASLPPKYRSRYLNIRTKWETPLDLSVKQVSPQIANDVPIASAFTEVYTEPTVSSETPPSGGGGVIVDGGSEHGPRDNRTKVIVALPQSVVIMARSREQNNNNNDNTTTTTTTITNNCNNIHSSIKPLTPPLTPIKRKFTAPNGPSGVESNTDGEVTVERVIAADTLSYTNPVKISKTVDQSTTTTTIIKRESTPVRPIRGCDSAPKTVKAQPASTRSTKNKATRKLKFNEETSSPVSGTIIRPLEDITDGTMQYSNGDIDPKYNIVEITEETKAELAAIKNVIGDYICKLCRLKFDDAFGLARHRCACIVLLEYRCPECGKQFNCPANLASHRRWHKPKKEGGTPAGGGGSGGGAGSAAKKENRNTTNTNHSNSNSKGSIIKNSNSNKKLDELMYACDECGKKFKRQAYLRKHKTVLHAMANGKSDDPPEEEPPMHEQPQHHYPHHQPQQQQQHAVIASTALVTGSGHSDGSVSQQSYGGSTSSSSSSAASSCSVISARSYGDRHEEEAVYTVIHSGYGDYEANDSMSDCSNSSGGYGRLQIVETGLTEEENIAATALTNLRNCASVIQHTTLAH